MQQRFLLRYVAVDINMSLMISGSRMGESSKSSAVRTVISLSREDKMWLDAEAEREGVSMTEMVRTAVRGLRRAKGADVDDLDSLLQRTRRRWRRGDGLSYQRRIRSDWHGRRSPI